MHRLIYALFMLGVFLKLLHLPYNTLFLLGVLVALLVLGVIRLVKLPKDRANTVAHLAIAAWLFHGVVVLKLLPIQFLSLSLAVLMTGLAIHLSLRWHSASRTVLVSLLFLAILVLGIMAVPVPARYHFSSLRFSLERRTDAHSWDKYSFLLHSHGDTAAALSANDSAQVAAQRGDQDDLLPALLEHQRLLNEGDWKIYHVPGH